MKTVGLIGGISWVSTADYYSQLNQKVNARAGGLTFPQLLIYSFNYAQIKKNNDNNDWDATFDLLTTASQNLIRSGAEGIALCANTMHLIADRIQAAIDVPLINIADATAQQVEKNRIQKVGLLGTRFTMEQEFFKKKLIEKNIEVLIPEEEEKAFVHQTIFDELGKGIITVKTKSKYQEIIAGLQRKGAEGIILGCTEIPLLIKDEDVQPFVFDTTNIHTDAICRFILED
jgi:aspartate racemase